MKPLWCDKATVGQAVLPVPGCGFPAASAAAALAGEPSPFVQLLSGEWAFLYCPSVTACPQQFASPEFADTNFDKLTVPGNWQLAGYDKPIYSNTRYPYALSTHGELPDIDPAKNPVGVYRRRFAVPQDWAGRRVLLQLDGAESAAEVWCNGRSVGFCLSSFDAHRFDLTGLLTEGENLLTVRVFRYSTGSYLEDQDMWRMSGLFRDVWLVAEPACGIADLTVKTLFPDGYESAVLDLSAAFSGALPAGAALQLTLQDPDGTAVLEKTAPLAGADAHLALPLAQVRLWSDEDPQLYRLAVSLTADGAVLDARGLNVGFREIRIDGERLLLNGQALKLRGVNRHEFAPACGRAVSAAQNEADIRLLKQNNFNALRTSHYPDSEAVYDLCDRYGILVMSECNLETHGLAKKLPRSDPGWTAHALDRLEKSIARLHNHPCIIFWSLGNECYMGRCFVQMYRRAKELDDTRPIHYEGDTSFKATDVYSQMYAQLDHVARIGRGERVFLSRCSYPSLGRLAGVRSYGRRPYLQCEYAHCMGNSLGNFADYWELYRKYDRLAGGFIWDFADQALQKDGRWCYGGDFGDEPNDGPFAFNGLVRADRTPNPALFEARQVLSPFALTVSEAGARVESRQRFAAAKTLAVRWAFCEDGVSFAGGETAVPPLAPGAAFDLPLTPPPHDGTGAVDLVCTLVDTAPSAFAAGGRVLCGASLRLRARAALPPTGYVDLRQEKKTFVFAAGGRTATVRRRDGFLAGFTAPDGKELLAAPLRPQLARALTDNDCALGLSPFLRRFVHPDRWLRAERRLRLTDAAMTRDGVRFSYRMPGLKKLALSYRMTTDGALEITLEATPARKDLPRAGVTFAAAPELRSLRWFGRGPQENYCDRCTGALPGLYELPAEQFCHDYLHPQENGNRTGVERFAVYGAAHALTAVTCAGAFEASAWPYTREELENAAHADELTKTGPVTVSLDAAQRGVGGDLPAVAVTKERYCLHKGETYTLRLRLTAE